MLFLQFRGLAQALPILLSIPFALIGGVWLPWLLDPRRSPAVCGELALGGLVASFAGPPPAGWPGPSLPGRSPGQLTPARA